MNNIIKLEKCNLRFVTCNDSEFIHKLFSVPDINKYYALRSDHANNLDSFIDYMIQSIQYGHGLNYIIEDLFQNKIGLITAELVSDPRNGNLIWNVGYAIYPTYRHQGFATTALNGLSKFLLHSFSISEVSLDISVENKDSEKVAQRCGFKKPQPSACNNVAYVDLNHLELGSRNKWYKSLNEKRIVYFNQAANAYRNKDYQSSVNLFIKALTEEYQDGTPYTDAQIFSNLGMAYSSLHLYKDAYKYLRKAKSLGLTNSSIEKELKWLENHINLF